MATYKRICAWCNPPSVIEAVEVPDDDSRADTETHGICETCADKLKTTIKDHREVADKAEEVLKQ